MKTKLRMTIFLAVVAVVVASFPRLQANSFDLLNGLPFMRPDFDASSFQKRFHQEFFTNGALPEAMEMNGQKFAVQYTINQELEERVESILRTYRSDFASVVILDNATGDVLTAVDLESGRGRLGRATTFTPSHPAASVFKIITAADLLENTHIGNDTEFAFAGRSTTLYKYQLKGQTQQRWSRRTDFEHAFARSNNVIFGKAAIENLSPTGLSRMAEKFGFNRDIMPFMQATPSVFPLAVDQYNLAELASGFNVKTLISPVHGAAIASVIANGGTLRRPTLIKKIVDSSGKIMWESGSQVYPVVTPETSEALRKMMLATVSEGTARNAFRRPNGVLKELEIGGKTGSITGGQPFGKRDWFVAYAKNPNDSTDKGISICIMIVNKRRWYIKSTRLARQIIEQYYGKIKSTKG